ncbi:hypothetical protein Tco_0806016 [Tanacetum coccineum]
MPSRAEPEILFEGRHMDLFNLISALNPAKVKTGSRPRAAHEVPLLTVTANRVIDMEDPAVASGSSGTPSTIERSPTVTEGTRAEDQAAATTEVIQEVVKEEEVVVIESPVNKRRKQMRRKRVNEEVEVNAPPKVLRKDLMSSPANSIRGGKSLAAMGLVVGSTFSTPDAQDDSTTAKIQHEPGAAMAMASQLRLRFEQEAKLLKKVKAKIARRDQRVQNLETLLEAEVDMKKAAEAKNAELTKELESLRVTDEERIKAACEEFKKYEDNKVEQRCAKMDARLDKLSVDFDEELYPHMLTAIASRRWVFPKVRAPEDPWVVKEEVPLEDAIATNISRAEKKKKCTVVCRTHGIGSAHHARFDGIPVSVPTVVPQGLAILLTDAGTQTQRSEDEASPRLFRSKSLPPMYNLDWP